MLATSVYMIVFRLVHILAGVIWVGGLFAVVAFVQPSAATLGPAGGPFVQEMLARRRLPAFLVRMGMVTVGAGLLLYWRDWQATGSFGAWIGSSYGAVLTVGALLAIVGLAIGGLVVKPTIERMLSVAAELGSAGGPPAPERAAELQGLQARARLMSRTVLALLILSVLSMATARYW